MKPIKMLVLLAVIAASTLSAAAAPAPAQGRMPDLLDRAVADGELSRVEADVMLARVLAGGKAPAAYRGTTPWHGTTVLLDIERRAAALTDPVEIQVVGQALEQIGRSRCGSSVVPTTQTLITDHFQIEHTVIFGGLTVEDYAAALEQAWTTQVDSFGWAAPPGVDVPPGEEKYLVRIDPLLEPIIYGFVAARSEVGDNPNTAWTEKDAYSSCMVLNANYANGLFPSTPRGAMEATAAHEFNHSIQFGYGALIGDDRPQSVFIEGGATWMEDEVFDDADDSYFYLWPDFRDSMGGNQDFPYSYWIVWRGLTERLGAGIAGGGEDVFQAFWEQVSKEESTGLTAMRAAIAFAGLNLDQAFHDMAIGMPFMRACGGGYVLPYCYEEAEGYVDTARQPRLHGFVDPGQTGTFTIRDHYATNWIELQTGDPARMVTVTNEDQGVLRATIACDTGTTITTTPFPLLDQPGETASVSYDGSTCLGAILVVTNSAGTSDAPSRPGADVFTVAA